MKTNSPGPYAAVTERYPLHRLEPGDRFHHRGKLVQVVAREVTAGVNAEGRPFQLRVQSVTSGRPFAQPVPDAGRVDGVQLLADRPRPEMLTLDFFAGGSGSIPDRDGAHLAVPLTLGGNVDLHPSFVGAGVQMTSTSQITTRPTFYKMVAAVKPTNTAGNLGLIGQRSHDLWGRRQWDLLGTTLRSIGLLDGGLSPAGEALLDIADTVRVVDEERAWFEALSAATGVPLPASSMPVLSAAAANWTGSPTELLTAIGAAVA